MGQPSRRETWQVLIKLNIYLLDDDSAIVHTGIYSEENMYPQKDAYSFIVFWCFHIVEDYFS